jgi:hypothetical protein
VGWSSGAGDRDSVGVIDETMQANYLTRSLLLLWQAGVERSFWYSLKDDPGNPYGLFQFGEGRDDYSLPKPAYAAFRTLNQQVSGASFLGLSDLFKHTPVFDFDSFGTWRRGDQPYGTFSNTKTTQRDGQSAGALNYTFPSSDNDFVVFVREQPIPIPNKPYALGLWVYGDGSGNTLKVWLRDAEGELLQYSFGAVGEPGWHELRAPITEPVAEWDRINSKGNGVLNFPASVYAIVLDDAPDTFAGRGTIYVDSMTAISGPEAYNLRLQRGNTLIDVLWSPDGVNVRVPVGVPSVQVVESDGTNSTQTITGGALTSFTLGDAPRYVVREQPTPQ